MPALIGRENRTTARTLAEPPAGAAEQARKETRSGAAGVQPSPAKRPSTREQPARTAACLPRAAFRALALLRWPLSAPAVGYS
jgi:hypothetical protein